MTKRLVLLALACLLPHAAHAQGQGTISGVIADSSGAVIPNAQVKVAQEDLAVERTVSTGGNGRFVVPSLRPAEYTVTASSEGFKTHIETVRLLADQTVNLIIQLDLGQVTETVTVESAAVNVDTSSPTLDQVVEQERMVGLPLDGRNAATLMLLVGGVVEAPSNGVDQGNTKTFPGAQTNSVNGARQASTSYNLDGAGNIDPYTKVNQPFPNPDALQEFSVQTSNYSAEYGQNAGAVINIVTKSGSNELHGTLFGFHRNEVFNARNFFAPERDPLKRTQYGASAGGPIVRNRTFIFGSWQSTDIRSSEEGLTAFVPTNAQRQGDFSALLDADDPANARGRAVQVVDPLTGDPFPNNMIPVSRFDPASVNFLEFLPQEGGNGRTIFSRRLAQDFDEFVVRLDHNHNDNNRFFGRYFYDEFDNAPGFDGENLLTLKGFSNIESHNVSIGHTRIFAANALNELNFMGSRVINNRGQPSGVPSVNDFGVNIGEPRGGNAIESIDVDGFFDVGAFTTAYFPRTSYAVRDNFRWTKGRHQISFGGEFQRTQNIIRNHFTGFGQFDFTSDVTNDAIASLMLGKLRQFKKGDEDNKDAIAYFWGLYIQDSFRATSRLNLEFGLRYDPLIPWDERRGRAAQFRPDAFHRGETSQVFVNAPPGMFFPGDPGFPSSGSGTKSDFNNWAPRFGFAYDLTGDGKTSIRGGVGVFYDARQAGIDNNRFEILTPFSTQITVTDPEGPFSDPQRGTGIPVDFFPRPFPPPRDAPFPRPVLMVSFDPDKKFVTPISYNWNLTLEHQLLRNTLLRAAYVASHGSQLKKDLELNPARFIPGSNLPTDARRLFQGFQSIGQACLCADSSYQSLQLGLERRAAEGLTLLVNYTFSRSIDDLPPGVNPNTVNPAAVSTFPFFDPRSVQFDTGPSDFDRTHRFVASYVWDLPTFSQSSNPWMKWAVGGWQVSGVFQITSGSPLTLLAGQDQSRTGLGEDRAVFLGGDRVRGGTGGCRPGEAPCEGFLDPSLFTLPAVGEFGNLGKGAVRGPDFWTWDMGFFKNIPLSETASIQVRAEFFNIFNRTNFNDPTVTVNSGGFGGIRSARDPRIGQFGLKILF